MSRLGRTLVSFADSPVASPNPRIEALVPALDRPSQYLYPPVIKHGNGNNVGRTIANDFPEVDFSANTKSQLALI